MTTNYRPADGFPTGAVAVFGIRASSGFSHEFHPAADGDLRMGGFVFPRGLPVADQLQRFRRGRGERLRLAQRAVDHRVAEEGPVVVGGAAE